MIICLPATDKESDDHYVDVLLVDEESDGGVPKAQR